MQNPNLSPDEIRRYFELRLGQSLRPNQDGQASARCVLHDDRKPSFSVDVNRGLWKCHAGCGGGTIGDFEMKVARVGRYEAVRRVREAVGHASPGIEGTNGRQIVATYSYTAENGDLVHEVVRFDPKGFAQRRPDGQGGWIWNMDGIQRVPYHLAEVTKAKKLFIVEGEKDADRLSSHGIVATTNPGGAGKWPKHFNPYFRGKQVVIIPDNDKAGRDHADDVFKNLQGVVESVKIVELPGLPEKGDASDWLDAGHTIGELGAIFDSSTSANAPAAVTGVLDMIPSIWTCEISPIQWAVEQVLPMGSITLLSGAPNVGKTWFGLDLAKAILQSGHFLGRRATPRKVIYCDRENPPAVIRQRLDDLQFEQTPDFHYWGFQCDVAPPLLDDPTPYIEIAQSLPTPPVFIFDTLVRFHSAESENSSSAMAPVMAALRRIAAAEATVLVLHHRGKSEFSQYRGSSDIQAAVDLSFMLAATDDSGTLLLSTTKNRLAEGFEIAMKLDLNAGGFAAVEDPSIERSRQEFELVRVHIQSNPGSCQSEIVQALRGRISAGRVRAILNRPNNEAWHGRKKAHNRTGYYPGVSAH